jgi:hypothetical protein
MVEADFVACSARASGEGLLDFHVLTRHLLVAVDRNLIESIVAAEWTATCFSYLKADTREGSLSLLHGTRHLICKIVDQRAPATGFFTQGSFSIEIEA